MEDPGAADGGPAADFAEKIMTYLVPGSVAKRPKNLLLAAPLRAGLLLAGFKVLTGIGMAVVSLSHAQLLDCLITTAS